MGRKESPQSTAEKKTQKGSGWESLTWDDLERWAGDRSVARGRAYQKQRRVKEMAISEDGRLVAFVEGGERYVTAVELESGTKKKAVLDSQCTCPVGYNGCKHAVAVVAAYLQAVADGKTAPLAANSDPRWKKLASRFEGGDDYDEDFNEDLDDEFEDDDDFEEDLADEEPDSSAARKPSPRPATKKQTKIDWDARIKEHIRGKNAEELAEILESLVERYPELREEFREQIALGEGDVDRLVAQARKELQELSAEMARIELFGPSRGGSRENASRTGVGNL